MGRETAAEPAVWRYHLPGRNGWGEGWATFLLDSRGMLAVCSDYGDYSYHWPPGGWGNGDFREFLLSLETSYYLPTKLSGGHREYDGEATERGIREQILELRREEAISREDARREWELLEWCDVTNEYGFVEWSQRTELELDCETRRDGFEPELRSFCELIWPRFREALMASIRTPVCSVCNDTHMMPLGDDSVLCTYCPVPCQRCRAGGNGPYCDHTPCECECHYLVQGIPV